LAAHRPTTAIERVLARPGARPRGALARWGATAATWAIACALTLALAPYIERAVFVFFWVAVLFAAWFAGLRPAIAAAAAAVAVVDYFLFPPADRFGPMTIDEVLTLVIFVLAAVLVSVLARRLARNAVESEEHAHELATLAQRLEEQAIELGQQTEEAQSLTEELEESNQQLEEMAADAEESRDDAERERRRLAAVFEGLPDHADVYDRDWRWTYMNPVARDWLRSVGLDPDAVVGRSVWEVFPALRATKFYTEALRAIAEGRVVEHEERSPTDGRWYETRVVPLPGAVVTLSRDITARRAQLERERLLAAASAVLSSSLDFQTTIQRLAEQTVPGFADWCSVTVVNPETESLEPLAVAHADPARVQWARELNSRYPPVADAPQGVPAVVRTGRTEHYPNITDAMLVAGARDAEHLRIMRELGFRSVVIAPLTARGRTFGALTAVTTAESGRRLDEADVALVEELARRAALAIDNARLYALAVAAREGAERANRAKSDFLAVMSHELRTPLNAIAGYAELMDMELRGPVTDAQREDLARIRRSQRHLLSLINDVLNFTRVDAGRIEYHIEPVALGAALASVGELVGPQLAEKGLTYEYAECASDLVARADREKLQQVVLNLLSNAIKFTPAGGRVTLRCARSDAGNVLVQVADTGIGIPHDQLDSIFEPFVQVRSGLTRTEGGTGLGLAISRDLARAMGGDLRVESTVGDGSTFTLVLPSSAGADGRSHGLVGARGRKGAGAGGARPQRE
jgi:PAS domain S-box-containing protein